MKKNFKPGTLLAPVPAVMVSVGDMENSNIITIAWTGIVNSEPPMTYVSIRPSRFSHDIVEKNREFVINIPGEALAKETDWCGVKSGRDVDKFKETGLTKAKSDVVSAPLIEECPVNFECKVVDVLRYGTHDMFIAEIVAMHVNEEIIDEEGRFDYSKIRPLGFAHGDYYGLSEIPVGRFGFSVMKPKTKKKISKAEHEKRVEKNRQKRLNSEEKKQSEVKQGGAKQKNARKQKNAGKQKYEGKHALQKAGSKPGKTGNVHTKEKRVAKKESK